MSGLELPEQIKTVWIYADADIEKFRGGKLLPSPGLKAANDLAAALKDRGIEVTIEKPPVGMDWLDVLNSSGQQQ
jgi:hypothetical protein